MYIFLVTHVVLSLCTWTSLMITGIYLPLLWEANFCWKSPVALGYTRGHFSALVGSGSYNGSCEQCVYLPLVDHHGYSMPVHFLTEQEVKP